MKNERGRPRSFDIDVALNNVLQVFWKHGFQNTSMNDLVEATGLKKSSLYAAFGDKSSLYLKTLECYLVLLEKNHAQILISEQDGRCAVEAFLRSLAEMLTSPHLPGGCFIVNGTADLGGSRMTEGVEVALRSALKGSELLLKERLLRAQLDKQLPSNINPKELAELFFTLIAGLAMQAKGGASREKLDLVIGHAMRAWPE
ncbi:hypothetical protein MNBD_GAMMA03-1725 [hydrothermal vent metagenome]|uniref:HTH tetR-type domain-containing protein n=1 Tax=hydrothermal vent metagenome TaxID=652676 RepID=A0A3B0W1G9_9ZZZZ